MIRRALLPTLLTCTVFLLIGCNDQLTEPKAPRTGPQTSVQSGPGGPPGGPPGSAAHCDQTVPDDHATIQAAVDAASAGAHVCVKEAGGPYAEQVLVNKDLVLKGINGPVIQPAASPDAFTIPESGPTWEPMFLAYGGSESGGAVSGSGTVDVSVTGFVFDGEGEQPDARRKVAVLFRNVQSSKGIAENTIKKMGVGGKETFGILAYGDSKATIAENTVSEYERGGIGANGDGGAHPAPQVTITGNEVTGSTGIEEAWGPNGIQIGFGATGKIVGNTVADNRYSSDEDADWVASCIIVFESDGVQVRKNQVENCDVGISSGSWAWFLPSADNLKIMGNTVRDAHAGIVLQGIAWDGISTSDPSVSNDKVVRNTLVGDPSNDSDVGVAIDASDQDPTYDPVLNNNKIIRNTFQDFATDLADEGTASKIAANDQPAFGP